MKWIEARAVLGSREALVRCALDLLQSKGFRVRSAAGFEEVGEGDGGEGEGGARGVRCVVGVDRAGVDDRGVDDRGVDDRGIDDRDVDDRGVDEEALGRALGEVSGVLEGRVAFREVEAPARGEAALEAGARGASWEEGFVTEAIDHTADEAFSVTARDRADLLAAAAEALGGLIAHPGRVAPARSLAVEVSAPEANWADDDRLFAWLAEVLYTLDKERFALRRAVVLGDSEGGVRGAVLGEALDEERHVVRGGIKAVTYHGLAIEVVPGGLRAEVVVDV